jgi:hypothetical protein
MKWRVLILLLVMAFPARAGVIQWRIALSASVVGDQLHCTMTVTNSGNEAARDVGGELDFNGARVALPTAPLVGAGHSLEMPLPAFPRPALPGKYPIIGRLNYADMNGYPFSAIVVHPQDFDTVPPALFAVRPVDIALNPSGAARVVVSWRGSGPIDAAVRLVAPSDLRVTRPEPGQRVVLQPGEQKEIEVALEAGDALEGSSYAAFLLLEGEENGLRHLGLGAIRITVAPALATTPRIRLAAGAVIAACALLMAWSLIRRRRSPGRTAPGPSA